MAQEKKSTQQQIKVRYSETSAVYASQVILNATDEDVTINFSSGPMSDPASGETMLPVHTRIAMSRAGAKRLHAVLGQVLSREAEKQRMDEAATAQLPKMKQ